ncbi:MAG: HAD family hydrolase [Victivallales bacterium]|nr:HAD family hydrolase [Victivallales bacterium]
MKKYIRVIGFDADDTLWDNQPQFDLAVGKFVRILAPYCTEETAAEAVHKVQMENLPLYGFGAKSLTLSMTQTACKLSDYRIDAHDIEAIIELGKSLLSMPVKLLDHAEETVRGLKDKYILILVTKGDLMDQQRKLRESGLLEYFHHIEILSDKKVENYRNLFNRLKLKPQEFAMVGNSLKSDIIPVLELDAKAIYIPYHSTWEHERADGYIPAGKNFIELKKLSDLLEFLN